MRPTLVPGLVHTLRFTVTDAKTVPALYPEAPSFQSMPAVFATGFMVGFLEWACLECVLPHLEPGEQTVGTHVDFSHLAATPPGMEVVATATLVEVDGRRLEFEVEARDAREAISKGRHQRFVIDRAKFDAKLAAKAAG
jgi:fluoroacetyl-CoA thioesterase